MRAPAKIYMRKNSLLRKDAPACLPEKFANPNADSYAITGLQGITGIAEQSGIGVAKYLTELPPREILEQELHKAIAQAKERIDLQLEHRKEVGP